MLQLQLRSEDWRCWQEDRGETVCEREREERRLLVTVWWVCTFRWQVLRWCWAVIAAAAYLWAGEGQVEMWHLHMKPCRLAGHRVDGVGAWRRVKSLTGTVWPCSTVPCKYHHPDTKSVCRTLCTYRKGHFSFLLPALQDNLQSPKDFSSAEPPVPCTKQWNVLHPPHCPITGGGCGQGRQADSWPQTRYTDDRMLTRLTVCF